MDTKGYIMWAVFIVVCAVIILVSRKIRNEIETGGIETTGVISRISESGAADDIDIRYYAEYRIDNGDIVEGLLQNPRPGLEVGQQVRIKYHPKYKENARLV